MTGFAALLRLFLARDKWMILAWTAGITLLYWSQAISIEGVYQSQHEFDAAAALMEKNAAFIAMAGPPRALNTVGGQVTWQASAFGAVCAGLMSMFLIGRHTRAEEESGRDELLRSTALGRWAPQTAALVTALIANAVVALGVGGSLLGYGLPAQGSLASALQVGLTGAVFAGTALVAAQLTQSTRGMYGIAGAILAVAYVLRAIGDVGNGVLSWLSPIGWGQAMHAYSGDDFGPALLLAAAAVLAVVASYLLFERRDVGSGLFAARPGPARASAGLLRPWGLAWRLHRGSVLGWTIGLFLFGLAYGSIGDSAADLIGGSEVTKEILEVAGAALVDGFFANALLMLSLLACGFAISSALRPRSEEEAGRVEGLLATALPRGHWFAAHGVVTVIGVFVIAVGSALGMAAGYAGATGDWDRLGPFLAGSLSLCAGTLVWVGFARLLYALNARWAPWAWLGLGFSTVVMLFARPLRFPDWLSDLSPYTHLALVPAEEFAWRPVLVLLALVALLWWSAQAAFARRDVH
ncbi:ABC transporter permease [Nocardioides daejeonensis]|uniref:ABC transporter permease n=1 Tax=Nocardioides daejeonensis TaxID=1046556 RepID=UPI000D7501E5|nr:ABC transporter permease [Nocardioides daejeonensis]